MEFFLQVDGIEGDAVAVGHERWFAVTGVSWAIVQPIAPGGGSGSDTRTGRAQLQPLEITMPASTNDPLLFAQAASGRRISKALFEAVREGETPMVTARWELADAVIASMSVSGTDGDQLEVSLSLGYRALQMTTFDVDETGARVEGSSGGWDAESNRPV